MAREVHRPPGRQGGSGDGLAAEDVPGGGLLLRHIQVLPGTAAATSQPAGERGGGGRASTSRPAECGQRTAARIHLRLQPLPPVGMGTGGSACRLHAVPAWQPLQEGGAAGELEWRLLGAALFGGAGALSPPPGRAVWAGVCTKGAPPRVHRPGPQLLGSRQLPSSASLLPPVALDIAPIPLMRRRSRPRRAWDCRWPLPAPSPCRWRWPPGASSSVRPRRGRPRGGSPQPA
jgi:hypothetical protein